MRAMFFRPQTSSSCLVMMFLPFPTNPFLGVVVGLSELVNQMQSGNEILTAKGTSTYGFLCSTNKLTSSVGVIASVLPIDLVFRAVAVLIRMNHAVVLKGYGDWKLNELLRVLFILTCMHK